MNFVISFLFISKIIFAIFVDYLFVSKKTCLFLLFILLFY